MTEVRIVEPSRINWDVRNVLYRGNTQKNFEAKILCSFIEGKPIYYGFTTEGKNRTYVGPSLASVLIHTGGKSLADIERTHDFFTEYPLVVYIRADRYLDKLREGEQGEGIFIEGNIDADDVCVLFSSECDKIPEQIDTGKIQGRACASSYEFLLNEIRSRGFDQANSLIKRFERKQQDATSPLEQLCFGSRLRPTTQEEQQKIAEAMNYLKRKLEGN